jgi:hypothetical protein
MSELKLVLNDWTKRWMPYQFMSIKVGRVEAFLPVNRSHMPLGLAKMDFKDYSAYEHQAVTFGGDPYAFDDIWIDPKNLTLYGDTAKTREDYFLRLARLANKTIRLVTKGA